MMGKKWHNVYLLKYSLIDPTVLYKPMEGLRTLIVFDLLNFFLQMRGLILLPLLVAIAHCNTLYFRPQESPVSGVSCLDNKTVCPDGSTCCAGKTEEYLCCPLSSVRVSLIKPVHSRQKKFLIFTRRSDHNCTQYWHCGSKAVWLRNYPSDLP